MFRTPFQRYRINESGRSWSMTLYRDKKEVWCLLLVASYLVEGSWWVEVEIKLSLKLEQLAYAERFRILGIRFRSAPRWFVYRRNSEINPIAPQLLEIEAIQTSLFVDVPDILSAMSKSLSASLRFKILRLLLLHWTSSTIVEEIHCCSTTVYNVQENLFMYNSSFRSQFRLKDASRKIFKIAENDLIVYLEDQSWCDDQIY